MKASGLRIGNFIRATLVVLDDIDTGASFVEREIRDGKDIDNAEWFEPIPLTEEWHNKFGVQKNGFGNFEYDICPFGRKTRVLVFSGDYLYIRDMSGKDRTEDDLITIWNKDIKKNFYVHEWQNLYFALSGKELKRKKKIK